jgi:hypothetical protein
MAPDTGMERTNGLIMSSLNEFSVMWSRVVGGHDREVLLASAAFGLTVTLRILRWQYRARIERRLQAAAAAYAARELAQERRGNLARLGESGFAV